MINNIVIGELLLTTDKTQLNLGFVLGISIVDSTIVHFSETLIFHCIFHSRTRTFITCYLKITKVFNYQPSKYVVFKKLLR